MDACDQVPARAAQPGEFSVYPLVDKLHTRAVKAIDRIDNLHDFTAALKNEFVLYNDAVQQLCGHATLLHEITRNQATFIEFLKRNIKSANDGKLVAYI